MHPTTLFLSLAALASVAVSTKDKDNGPRCAEDEYYNKMMESKNRKAAVTDCAKWLGETTTNPNEIPKYLKDCGGDKEDDRVSRVSAACSCIKTSSVPLTFSTSTHLSSTTSTTAVITTSSQAPGHLPSSSVSSTGSTSQTHSTPSSSRHSSTTSTQSSSNHPPSGSSGSAQVTFSTTSSLEVLPTASSSPPHTSARPSESVPPSSSKNTTGTSTASILTVLSTTKSTVTAPGSTISSSVSSQASTTSFTTSTIYTESIYTVTSCAPGKSDCPAASTELVTSTIAISTTICPVTETARPTTSSKQTTTRWTTTTIYSTSTSTLIRCPPGASNCPVGNLPISTVIPVSTTVLPIVDGLPTPDHGNQGGSDTKKEGTPTQPGVSGGKSDVPSPTFTVVTVPTTIHTIMNGVFAQILTVVPVTSALGVGNNADSAPAPSSTADADPHAGDAQQAAAGTGSNSGGGNQGLSSTPEPSHPQAAPTDASFDATAWQSTEPSRSGLTWKPMLPANNTPVAASTSSRPPVVTAGAPGLVGGDGMGIAFFAFALAALL